MSKWRENLKIIGAAIGAAIVFLISLAWTRRRGEKTGEEIGHLEESKERLNEAEKRGDDVAVLEEFRRQTKGKR